MDQLGEITHLLISDHNMASLSGSPNRWKTTAWFRQIEIKINLHAAVVGVARHRVPERARRSSVMPMTNWQLFTTLG